MSLFSRLWITAEEALDHRDILIILSQGKKEKREKVAG
jgi:hypothetical protein